MSRISLEDWYTTLAATDALVPVTVNLDGGSNLVQFSLPPGWNVGIEGMESQDVTEAKMGVDAGGGGVKEYALTKEAILEVAHTLGLPPKYVMRTPGPLIQSHLNYWATHSPDTALRLLCKGSTALVVTKAGITPFSNTQLIQEVVEKYCEEFDATPEEIWVDSKSHHELAVTSTRLITPGTQMVDGEEWYEGIQIRNSLIGFVPVSLQGFVAREDLGVITSFTEGKWNRKTQGQDELEVHQWARDTASGIIEQMPHTFESMEHAAHESLAGELGPVLADTFRTYKVPLKARQPIMDSLLESEEFTYYGLVKALSDAANIEGLPEHMVTALMEIAGDVAQHVSDRCNSCKRVMV